MAAFRMICMHVLYMVLFPSQPKLLEKLADLKKRNLTPSAEHFNPLVNISRDPGHAEEYTTALYFTTKEYIYYIYVDKTNLTLKKYKAGDADASANPRNNKQFYDRQEDTNCSQCTGCSAEGLNGAKEETDGSVFAATAKPDSSGKITTTAEVASGDSANGSSNSASGNSSQLSSPESSSGIDPSTSKVLNDSVNQDSGVEANTD